MVPRQSPAVSSQSSLARTTRRSASSTSAPTASQSTLSREPSLLKVSPSRSSRCRRSLTLRSDSRALLMLCTSPMTISQTPATRITISKQQRASARSTAPRSSWPYAPSSTSSTGLRISTLLSSSASKLRWPHSLTTTPPLF